jgi:hypothetical protein
MTNDNYNNFNNSNISANNLSILEQHYIIIDELSWFINQFVQYSINRIMTRDQSKIKIISSE